MSTSGQKLKAPGMEDVGSRVSIRLRDPEYGLRDVLGVLETPNTVRRKNGDLWKFTYSDIVAWRIVPKVISRAGTGAPFSLRITELEEVAERTWPAAQLVDLHGWRLRISDGFTFRANSIRPTARAPYGLIDCDLDTLLETSILKYRERALTPAFHLALPTYQKLAEVLEERGWHCPVEAHVMVADRDAITLPAIPTDFAVEILEEPTLEWLSVQGEIRGREVMAGYPSKYFAIRGQDSNEWIAVGRISEADGWAFLTRLFVRPEFRGFGVSKVLVAAMIQDCAVDKIALQVDITNSVAIGLYKSLNFRVHHNYRYLTLAGQ